MFNRIRAAFRALTGRSEERARTWDDPSFAELFGGNSKTSSGVIVNDETAMRNNAVYSCVRVLADGAAMLPLKLYRNTRPRGKEEARNHPLWRVLCRKPNPWMTSFVWRQTMAGWRARTGNAYSEKVFAGSGQVAQLWPIASNLVTPFVTDAGELVYDISVPGVARRQRVPRERILHWRGWSPDGVTGYDPITIHRESIAIGLSVEEYQARFFGNGSRPGGVIEVAGTLGDDGRKRLKAGWESAHGGLTQSHRVAVLEQGAKWHQISVNPAEAQMMEAEKWNRRKIAAVFGVPLHRIQDIENASYATLEQQDREFMVHSLGPLLESLESEIDTSVISESDQEEYFAEHVMQAVLRGDFAQRTEGYVKMWNIGAISNDEIRDLENMNPLPNSKGGDYIMPLNVQAIPEGGVAAKASEPNAAQVERLMEIVAKVTAREIPAESGVLLVLINCPSMTLQQAKSLIEPAAAQAAEEPPKAPTPPAPDQPGPPDSAAAGAMPDQPVEPAHTEPATV